jgi:hypothetical protein
MTLNPHSISQNTRCHSKQAFTQRLRQWYDHTNESTIGGSARRGQTAWMWAKVGEYECHLNADTQRAGVRKYLELVDLHGPDMEWHVRKNQRGENINKVHCGPNAERFQGFYLYVAPSLESPATI